MPPLRKCERSAVRAVVDTNVWVSAIITPSSFSSAIIRHFETRSFVPLFCQLTVDELRTTLRKPRLARRIQLQFQSMNRLIAALSTEGEELPDPEEINAICRDPADDIFIALAVTANADYLVTRDDDLKGDETVREHLAEAGVQLVTVREFVAILEAAG